MGALTLVAHRAANDPTLLASLAAGPVDVVEGDVHLRRGRLEVRHTKRIWFLPILWDRWYLANPFTPPLLLDEVIDALPPGATLMLDLKGAHPGLGRAVRDLVDRRGPDELVVSARIWRQLRPFGDRPRTLLMHSAGSHRQLRRLLRRHPGRLGGLSVHRDLLDRALVARLRTRADQVWTWPVNTPEVAREVAGWGVTGVISDAPLAIARTVGAVAEGAGGVH